METGSGSASVCPRKGESHSAAAVSASVNAHSGNVVAVAPIGSDEVAASEHEAEITAENEPPAKKQKKATSMVWQYFTKTWETKTGADGIEVKELWAKCKKCSYKGRAETTRGTKAFWNHVEYKHSVKQGQLTIKLEKNDDNAVVQAYRYDPEASLKKWQLALVMHEYPFNMVEHEYFVDFIKSLRPGFSFKCRTSTRNNIIEMFTEEKEKLYNMFKTMSCRFSATMDMWTSIQNKGYMCITVHWVDDNWQMQKRIIKFMHMKGSHTGTNLANEFVKGVMSMNLEKKLFALTLDNASSNDKCVKELIPILHKHAPLICDGGFFHVRCLCHILNLVAQDGLKAIASSVQNVRDTVAIVKNSPLQWEEFQKRASECELDVTRSLSLDVTTRWNSTFDMLNNAVYFKKAFQRLLFLNESKYRRCAPSEDDWDRAVSLTKCLQKFCDVTNIFSGHSYPTANLFWRKFCEIKLAIRDWVCDCDETISTMAKSMEVKYEKYWDKSNKALAVACFLDPRYKQKLVEFFLKKIHGDMYRWEVELNDFMDVVHKLFQTYKSSISEAKATTIVAVVDSQTCGVDQEIEDFLYDANVPSQSEKTELETYMKEPLLRWIDTNDAKFDVLDWWRGKQGTFPILSRLARDVLSMQVSTVASESAFSAGGRVVDPFRSRLDPEVVEALICIKDWTAAAKKGSKEKKIASLMDEFDMDMVAKAIEHEDETWIDPDSD